MLQKNDLQLAEAYIWQAHLISKEKNNDKELGPYSILNARVCKLYSKIKELFDHIELARNYMLNCLEICSNVLGESHPDTIFAY